MWISEWRRRDAKILSAVNREQTLAGAIVISLLFLGVMHLQIRFGGKGEGVSLFLLPISLACIAMIAVAAAAPSALSDSVAAAGRALISLSQARRPPLQDLTGLLGWLVKALFLPLMLAWSFVWVSSAAFAWESDPRLNWFFATMAVLYAVDTAFATIGYLSTTERIGAQIRSTDRTWLGWIAALVCYPPLSVLVLDTWLIYKGAQNWVEWSSGSSLFSFFWGAGILALTAIYVWATVAFGPRFSNLTHRGIITSGPYKWCKHPAYLAKNLSWWMISVPFVNGGELLEVGAHCSALVGINAIYWVRALTEERHLRSDPTYVAYAQWISVNGVFARIKVFAARRLMTARS
jgi:protein-S-isoprenylcysteine O-methyltransferase Ste14